MAKYVDRSIDRSGEADKVFFEVLKMSEAFLDDRVSRELILESGYTRNLNEGEFRHLSALAKTLDCDIALETPLKASRNIFVSSGVLRRVLSGEFTDLHGDQSRELILDNMDHYEFSKGAIQKKLTPLYLRDFRTIFLRFIEECNVPDLLCKWRKQCNSGEGKYSKYLFEANYPAQRIAERYGIITDVGFIYFADVWEKKNVNLDDDLDSLFELSHPSLSALVREFSV